VFFQFIEEGIIVFLVNSVIGGLLFLAFRSYVRERVESWLFGAVSDYIREQLEITLRNPEATAKLLSPIINAIIKEVLKDYQKGQSEGMVKVPFLGKVPSPIIQALIERFLGGGSKSGNNEGVNPFG
jgi:hypothetical protein